jgi:hypothetical protein
MAELAPLASLCPLLDGRHHRAGTSVYTYVSDRLVCLPWVLLGVTPTGVEANPAAERGLSGVKHSIRSGVLIVAHHRTKSQLGKPCRNRTGRRSGSSEVREDSNFDSLEKADLRFTGQ